MARCRPALDWTDTQRPGAAMAVVILAFRCAAASSKGEAADKTPARWTGWATTCRRSRGLPTDPSSRREGNQKLS